MKYARACWVGVATAVTLLVIFGFRWIAHKAIDDAEFRFAQARIHLAKGNEYSQRGNHAAAEAEYSHALTWRPGWDVAEENLERARMRGAVALTPSNPEELRAAIKKDPDNDSLKVALVAALTSDKRFEEAGAVAIQISDLRLLGQVAQKFFPQAIIPVPDGTKTLLQQLPQSHTNTQRQE
jgi:hypothetical protein